ncbi:MAG: WecB/TagA/CpsF family glycosyltransferase [Clostridia bacterium]|nr:WecB/TagA/CpsF family glycosyltransferase [Clostridia bacterium]
MSEEKKVIQETILGTNPRIHILHTDIDVLDMVQTVELVDQYIQTKTPLHLMGVNADKINEVACNERMRQIVNSCGVINADGASVVLAARLLGKPLPERVAGVDLMQQLIVLSEKKAYRVYLLGAKQEVVEKTAQVLQERFPAMQLAGFRNGYFREDEWSSVSAEVRAAQPDIVFVGITSPMKEYLIEFMQNDGHDAVFMGVGGSFDVLSGNLARAPRWMQKANLEWLFRMLQEPRRLFKRYLVGNSRFIFAVLKEKLGLGKR